MELRRVQEVVAQAVPHITHRPSVLRVRALDAVGRILARDVTALVDVPPFDRAVVDGYAVRSRDTVSASPSSPVLLRLVKTRRVGPGEAVEVATGDPLPEGADAVVMYEHTSKAGPDIIEVFQPVPPFGNVSRRGEDVQRGQVIFRKGHIVTRLDVALLASSGNIEVEVYDISVALVCTGDEIFDIDKVSNLEELERLYLEGKVLNTTRLVLEHFLQQFGVKVHYVGAVPDDEQEIATIVDKCVEKHDMVIVTGGTALGKRDVTVRAVSKLKPKFMWTGLCIRPGRPSGIAILRGKPVLLLSGFPAAAVAGLLSVGKLVLEHLIDAKLELSLISGIVTRRVAKPPHLRAFVRAYACVDRNSGEIRIEPLAVTGSGLLTTLTRGNVLIEIPELEEGIDENMRVIAYLLGKVYYCQEQ